MGAFVSILRVPKGGSTDEECEDFATVAPAESPSEWLDGPVTAAVSDGASESLLAGRWAELLSNTVREIVHGTPEVLTSADDFAAVMVEASTRWTKWLAEYVAHREANDRPIRWYEEPKLATGAYATLLAARFHSVAGSTHWQAAGLGDSCLFHIRGTELLRSFPLQSVAAFTSTPALARSRTQDVDLLVDHVTLTAGVADQGDQFILCTDALAAWLLLQVESDRAPWDSLMELTRAGDRNRFAEWIVAQRSTGGMRNDDVAVVHVDLG
ncbi:protein phosphatase 2C domain-containing protein [Actinocrispum wychmicini]|uniref:Protein phosphatase 2C-like protein n=1 Tax=Actinocrispum wychmicini TaxID=1213861 RepID=A0A4R2ILC1_9PSEU|nr:protein phosphatase 2C domain-containing protein [Actinocrispum wychmicini]TCO44688.1 protein phosphatase 2C-like protein [Actinocrispum wychmicini]